jgi:hypothetical protein
MHAVDRNLSLIETELRFIACHVQNMETSDYEAQHEIDMAVQAALQALFEYRLSLEPACEEIPAGVPYPEAA